MPDPLVSLASGRRIISMEIPGTRSGCASSVSGRLPQVPLSRLRQSYFVQPLGVTVTVRPPAFVPWRGKPHLLLASTVSPLTYSNSASAPANVVPGAKLSYNRPSPRCQSSRRRRRAA